jgi:hypothetical protein
VQEGLWLGLENVQRCVSFALHGRIVFALSFDTSRIWDCSSENLDKTLLFGHVLFTCIPKNPDLVILFNALVRFAPLRFSA